MFCFDFYGLFRWTVIYVHFFAFSFQHFQLCHLPMLRSGICNIISYLLYFHLIALSPALECFQEPKISRRDRIRRFCLRGRCVFLRCAIQGPVTLLPGGMFKRRYPARPGQRFYPLERRLNAEDLEIGVCRSEQRWLPACVESADV